jgi:hypothetical protein
MELSKGKDGRYSVTRDIDSALAIFDRDGVLIATGMRLDSKKDGRVMVDLVIREYTMSDNEVRIREFSYPDAFDGEVRGSLRLNWWEQRSDYFSP